jgi:outer membrane protein OmpA-like peptidoglycan-associated protein
MPFRLTRRHHPFTSEQIWPLFVVNECIARTQVDVVAGVTTTVPWCRWISTSVRGLWVGVRRLLGHVPSPTTVGSHDGWLIRHKGDFMDEKRHVSCKIPWLWFLLPLLLLPLLGTFLLKGFIENDLQDAVGKRLKAADITDVSGKFNWQEGTYTGPAEQKATVEKAVMGIGGGIAAVDGIHKFKYISTGAAAPVADSTAITEPGTLPADTEAPPTESATPTEAATTAAAATEAVTTIAAAVPTATEPLDVTVAITGKSIVLNGTITDEAQRPILVDAAKKAYGDGNVTDNLKVVGPAGDAQLARVQSLADLLAVSSTTLDNGEGKVNDIVLELKGTALTAEGKASIEEKVASSGGTSTITVAAAATAAEVESQLASLLRTGINFETNSAVIVEDSKPTLDAAAASIIDEFKKFPNIKIEIAGHTDNRGKPAANQSLSERRAKAVLSYLKDKGVDNTRLSAKGFGDTQPIADNGSDGGRASNRRIEFNVIGG